MDTEHRIRRFGSAVCLGVHILDILGRPVARLPRGQTSLPLDEIRLTAAGTAAGTAVDLARLGVPVTAIGVVGDDVAGEVLLACLRREQVDVSLLITRPGLRTSATILPIRPNGDRPALHAAGASDSLGAQDLSAARLRAVEQAAVLHIGGPDTFARTENDWLVDLAARARDRGTLVTLDLLRSCNTSYWPLLARLVANVDWFLPNADQILRVSGAPTLGRALDMVGGAGTCSVVVTLGGDGCIVSDGGQRWRHPAFHVPVVDTTGCGDAFDAGFITGRLLGADVATAAWFGTACAALVATGLGSDAGITSLSDVLEFLARAQPLARPPIAADDAWPVVDVTPKEAAFRLAARIADEASPTGRSVEHNRMRSE
jgi:sugar/nucleoside kinase (ribokinase family)